MDVCCMKWLFLILILSTQAHGNLYSEIHYNEEPEVSRARGKQVVKTRTALMRIKAVRKKTKYLERKIKSMTFGEYADEVLYVAPFITGDFQFTVNSINFYYNRNSEKAGVKYKFSF